MKLYTSGEDYLKAIYILSKDNHSVKRIDISEYLNVSKPSVTRAIKLLIKGGFIQEDSLNCLFLTDLGIEIASKIANKFLFFKRMLYFAGVDESVSSEEACKMEHSISNDSFNKIIKYYEAYYEKNN